MTFIVIFIAVVILLMILSIIFNLKFKIKNITINLYWLVVLLAAIISICFGFIKPISLKEIFLSDAKINPVKILVLFLTCSSISVLLDQIGFFNYIAQLTTKKASSNQTKLFFVFNAIIALLTIFTSNDILILTFTPFICYFSKRANINPIPYIVSEFVTANTWSMFFYIGNPTNIYMATMYGISFTDYALKMCLPTIVAGLLSLFILYFVFRRRLSQSINVVDEEINKPNKVLMYMGVLGLIFMIIFMVVAPYINIEIWYIPLFFSVITYLSVLIYLLIHKENLSIVTNALKQLPYSLIPFLLGMSVLVFTLKDCGFMDIVGSFIENKNPIIVGLIAFTLGNFMNNIPMTMFFASAFSTVLVDISVVYSVIIASNICAYLTPIGALAGIMFVKILRENNVKYSFKDFICYGVITAIPTLLITILIMLIV